MTVVSKKAFPHSRRAGGFTVVELSVSLLVLAVVLLGLLALFDFSNRISSVQTNVSDMQQNQRVAQQEVMRLVRMAGRGPIPLGQPPIGMAVAAYNQVPASTHIGGINTPEIVPGSDVLTVRGIFTAPIYQVNSSAPNAFAIQTSDGGFSGHVDVSSTTPTSIPQNLQFLKDAVASALENNAKPAERLLLVSARNPALWTVVALNATASDVSSDPIRLEFTPLPADDPGYFDMPAGNAIADLGAVAFVGILEEYRFYLRQAFKVAPNGSQDVATVFSRARVFPGTDRPWRGLGDDLGVSDDSHPSWKSDIADNIIDLQVALAFDTPRGGGAFDDDDNNTGDDDRIYESADGSSDDWLFNDGLAVNPLDWANKKLYFIRLTTLARSDRRDQGYRSPDLVKLEDHDLSTTRFNTDATDRMFRYRPLETLIDMRNL